MKISQIKSRNVVFDFDYSQCELAETQAILQKTEEQLLQSMEQNQCLEEQHVGQSQARVSGYHDNPGSIQDVIGHLYLNAEDAKKLLITVKSRLKVTFFPSVFDIYWQKHLFYFVSY